MHYMDLKDSYLFFHIAQKTKAFMEAHPGTHLYRMGIGDVSLPLCDAVIEALHEAVDDQAAKDTFHGYVPEPGLPELRRTIAEHYRSRGLDLSDDEVFVSSGASDELGDILDLFDRSSSALVIEPAYPAYVDANVIAGREIVHLASGRDNGFLPAPDSSATNDATEPVTILIGRTGFVFSGRPMSELQLTESFVRLAKGSKDTMIMIKCTDDSPHGYLVRALDILASVGLNKVSVFSM
jgi:aspartate/methionine/tyrosine aminotransferase